MFEFSLKPIPRIITNLKRKFGLYIYHAARLLALPLETLSWALLTPSSNQSVPPQGNGKGFLSLASPSLPSQHTCQAN